MDKNEAIKLAEAYKGLVSEHFAVTDVILYGSYSNGTQREDSDIDLLVDFLPGSTLLDQAGLIDALSAKLGRKVDVVSERALNKYLRQRILQEAIAL